MELSPEIRGYYDKRRKRSGYKLVPFNWNSSAPKNYLLRDFRSLQRLSWMLEVVLGHTRFGSPTWGTKSI